MDQNDLVRLRDEALSALTALAARTPRIEALWLQGSLARGDADALSDIDAYVAVGDDAFDEVFGRREAMLGEIGPVVAWSDATTPGLKCVHALLDGGVRLDLCFEPASKVAEQARPAVKVLADRGTVASHLRLGWQAPVSTVGRIVTVSIRMTRQGGTWPLRTLLREQWSTFAMMELDLINAQVAQLMAVQDDPALFYQNTFSLPRRLAPERRAVLDRLTTAVLGGVTRQDRRALLSAHLDVLDALVREGRAACAALGIAYPISDEGDAKLRRFLQEAWPTKRPAP